MKAPVPKDESPQNMVCLGKTLPLCLGFHLLLGLALAQPQPQPERVQPELEKVQPPKAYQPPGGSADDVDDGGPAHADASSEEGSTTGVL